MAQPWKSTVEQLRTPAPAYNLPPQKSPTPSQWTRDQLRVASRTPTPTAALPVTPAAVPPVAPAAAVEAPAAAKSAGWFKRTASALRSSVPTAEGAGRLAGGAVRLAGGAVRTALPAAVGLETVSHLNDYKINDPTNDSSVGGTLSALRADPKSTIQLMNPAAALGAAAAGGLGNVGRNLSKGALEAGMDLGSAAANIADVFVPGKTPVSTAYNSLLREKFGDQLVDKSGAQAGVPAALPGTSPAQRPTTAPTPTTVPGRGEGQAKDDAAFASAVKANQIMRDGNSYSGGPNITAGADIVNPNGTLRNGGLNSDRGFGVTSLDTSEGHRQNLLELQRNAADRAVTDAQPVGGMTGIGGGTLSSSLGESHSRQSTAMSTSNVGQRSQRQQDALDMQKAQLGQARDLAGAQLAVTQAGQNQGLRIAEMNNATQRENNAATTRTALRGHELDYEGRMAPVRLAQQQREIAQKFLGTGGGDPAAAHAQMVAAGYGDTPAAKALAEGVTTQLSQRASSDKIDDERVKATRSLFDGQGHKFIDQGAMSSLDPEARGKAVKAAEDQAHNWAMTTVPGFANASKEKQRTLAPKIAAMYELFLKTQDPDHTGNLGGLRTLFNKPGNAQPTNQQRPTEFFKGGDVGSRYGLVSGALTAGYENGDVDFTPAGGNSLRIKNPSAEALAMLRHMSAGKDPLKD